jgi:hypothetical protein
MSPAPKALTGSGRKAIKIVRKKRPGVNEGIWKAEIGDDGRSSSVASLMMECGMYELNAKKAKHDLS